MPIEPELVTVATLVFDGDCGFCTTAANWVVRRNQSAARCEVTAVPWQWANLNDLGITEAQARDRVWLIEGDYRYSGHRCFARILQLDRNPLFRLVGSLMTLPGLSCLAASGYRLMARFRHRLPGGTPACKL